MMWLLHLAALIFFMPALFVTIPMHIIIEVLKQSRGGDAAPVRAPPAAKMVVAVIAGLVIGVWLLGLLA